MIKQNLAFERSEISAQEAKELFKSQSFKLELIEELSRDRQPIITYKTASPNQQSNVFIDLCAGPHINSAREINPEAFKLAKIAGAYWRGSEKIPMLTRIYGVAFETKKELDEYLKLQEEAAKKIIGYWVKNWNFSLFQTKSARVFPYGCQKARSYGKNWKIICKKKKKNPDINLS